MTTTDEFLRIVTQSALGHAQTVKTTYDIARLAIDRGVHGDFVECGVYAGAQSAAMARALLDSGHIRRRVHLFDSFEGIPAAGEHDHEFRAVGHPAGLSACTMEQCQTNMRNWGIPDELLMWHPGMFERSIANYLGFHIAVLRLDGDLYESTKVCIERLLPWVSPGGWVIIDDFDLSGARKAVMDHFAPSAPAHIYFQVNK